MCFFTGKSSLHFIEEHTMIGAGRGRSFMKACIFDLDGTLTDTLESLTHSVQLTLEEMNYLRAVSQPNIHISQKTCSDGVLLVETTLSPQEIQRITVTEMM